MWGHTAGVVIGHHCHTSQLCVFTLEEIATRVGWTEKNSFHAFLNLLTSSSLMVHHSKLNSVALASHCMGLRLIFCDVKNKIIMRKK